MAHASELALKAIDRGILCQIKVDYLGLVVDATCGRGENRLSLRKFIEYTVLKSTKFDALIHTVEKVIKTLEEERNLK